MMAERRPDERLLCGPQASCWPVMRGAALAGLFALALGAIAAAASEAPGGSATDEARKHWPQFRGPGGLGVSAYPREPASWNGKTGQGILWKTEVPLSAPNSPVVWGDRVFLSGATKEKREVYCFDANTGKLLWQQPVADVPGSPAEPPQVLESTTFAPSTMATDGQRVFAVFANADLACFDVLGKRIWAKNLGKLENSYGHASSLALCRNLLLVQLDHGQVEDEKSKLLALDTATGKVVWEAAKRPVPSSWSTPIVIQTPKGEQVITTANPWVIAYSPEKGQELWRAKCLSGDVVPSPIYGNGLVFTANAGSKLAAIRPDGKGDVTATHVVWGAEDGLPDICSPLTDGKLVLLLSTEGLLTCYNAKDGQKLWEKEYETAFLASPTLVGDRVYLTSGKGVTYILAAARELKELGKAELGEEVRATPAFLDGRIYFRGAKHLFCIGEK